MASLRDLLTATKAQIREVTTAEADDLRVAPGAITLDVREADEWAASAEPAALVQHGETESKPILQMSTSTLGRHFDGFNGTGSSISVIGANCTGGWWNTGPTWAKLTHPRTTAAPGCATGTSPTKRGCSKTPWGLVQPRISHS